MVTGFCAKRIGRRVRLLNGFHWFASSAPTDYARRPISSNRLPEESAGRTECVTRRSRPASETHNSRRLGACDDRCSNACSAHPRHLCTAGEVELAANISSEGQPPSSGEDWYRATRTRRENRRLRPTPGERSASARLRPRRAELSDAQALRLCGSSPTEGRYMSGHGLLPRSRYSRCPSSEAESLKRRASACTGTQHAGSAVRR